MGLVKNQTIRVGIRILELVYRLSSLSNTQLNIY